MNQKQRLRLTIMLSLASTLAFSPIIGQAASNADAQAAPAKVVAAQELSANQLPQISNDIKILPINRAKLWRGQQFDFEVELPASTKEVAVTINGTDAAKVLQEKAEIINQGTHLSYRINDVHFSNTGSQVVKVVASNGNSSITRTANY